MKSRLSLLFVALLAGCAASPQRPAEPAAPDSAAQTEAAVKEAAAPAEKPAGPVEKLTPELLYGVLLGEIAGQRHQFGVATASYLNATKVTEDPRVARRAARIALFSRDNAAALEATRRWAQLAPEDVEAHQTLGLLLTRAGRVEAAVEAFDRYIELVGDREKALRTALHVLADERDREGALKVFQALSKRYPDDPQAALAYARLALQAERHESALQEVERALLMKGDWRDARLLRARILIGLDRPEKAVADMEAAVAETPNDHPLRVAYARMLVQLRSLEEASAQFREALRIQPEDDDVLYALALLALEGERMDEARGYLERLVTLEKRVGEAHYYLGVVAERQERLEDAVLHFSSAEGGEYGFNGLVRRAQLLVQLGRMEEARADLARVRGANPRLSAQLYQVEGELLREARDYAAALALYNEAVERHPEDDDILYSRALVAEKVGKIDVLERDLRDILARKPDHAAALNALGYTLADRTDRFDEALALITRALELTPDDPAVLDSAGWVRFRLGRLEEALEFLQRAMAMVKDPEIAAHLGEVLWVMDRRDEARKVWRELLDTGEDHPVLTETVERLDR